MGWERMELSEVVQRKRNVLKRKENLEKGNGNNG